MHTAAKIVLGFGGVLTVIGIIATLVYAYIKKG